MPVGLHRRVVRIEVRCAGSCAVARILRTIEAASDEELDQMNSDGSFEHMAIGLNERELDSLIAELKKMRDLELIGGGTDNNTIC